MKQTLNMSLATAIKQYAYLFCGAAIIFTFVIQMTVDDAAFLLINRERLEAFWEWQPVFTMMLKNFALGILMISVLGFLGIRRALDRAADYDKNNHAVSLAGAKTAALCSALSLFLIVFIANLHWYLISHNQGSPWTETLFIQAAGEPIFIFGTIFAVALVWAIQQVIRSIDLGKDATTRKARIIPFLIAAAAVIVTTFIGYVVLFRYGWQYDF